MLRLWLSESEREIEADTSVVRHTYRENGRATSRFVVTTGRAMNRDAWYGPLNRHERKAKASSYLQVANGSIEGIIAEAAFLVQEFSGFSIHGRAEQPVIEAFLQLLQASTISRLIGNQFRQRDDPPPPFLLNTYYLMQGTYSRDIHADETAAPSLLARESIGRDPRERGSSHRSSSFFLGVG